MMLRDLTGLIARAAESTEEGISISDMRLSGQPLIYVNKGFVEMSGFSAGEVLGKNCRFLQGPDTDRSQVDLLRQCIEKQNAGIFELLNYRKDGSSFWNRVSMVPLFDKTGELTHFVGIQSNITELKTSNQRLYEMNIEKNNFLGMASHDIRNPLTACNVYCELLSNQISDPKLLGYIDNIRTGNALIRRLVDDFLDYSKIEAGTLSLLFERRNIAKFLIEVLEPNALLAAEKDIRLTTRFAAESMEGNIDPSGITQVINNLIGNAIKFSPLGSTIIVSLETGDDSSIVVSIADDGPGIPEDERKNLFKAFASGSSKGSAGEKSTGLGLSIVQKIVRAHGGEVWWKESQRGKGSIFSFSLPVAV
ncbi:MAG: ATP-binding protein [Myxococcota bacterium]